MPRRPHRFGTGFSCSYTASAQGPVLAGSPCRRSSRTCLTIQGWTEKRCFHAMNEGHSRARFADTARTPTLPDVLCPGADSGTPVDPSFPSPMWSAQVGCGLLQVRRTDLTTLLVRRISRRSTCDAPAPLLVSAMVGAGDIAAVPKLTRGSTDKADHERSVPAERRSVRRYRAARCH